MYKFWRNKIQKRSYLFNGINTSCELFTLFSATCWPSHKNTLLPLRIPEFTVAKQASWGACCQRCLYSALSCFEMENAAGNMDMPQVAHQPVNHPPSLQPRRPGRQAGLCNETETCDGLINETLLCSEGIVAQIWRAGLLLSASTDRGSRSNVRRRSRMNEELSLFLGGGGVF